MESTTPLTIPDWDFVVNRVDLDLTSSHKQEDLARLERSLSEMSSSSFPVQDDIELLLSQQVLEHLDIDFMSDTEGSMSPSSVFYSSSDDSGGGGGSPSSETLSSSEEDDDQACIKSTKTSRKTRAASSSSKARKAPAQETSPKKRKRSCTTSVVSSASSTCSSSSSTCTPGHSNKNELRKERNRRLAAESRKRKNDEMDRLREENTYLKSRLAILESQQQQQPKADALEPAKRSSRGVLATLSATLSTSALAIVACAHMDDSLVGEGVNNTASILITTLDFLDAFSSIFTPERILFILLSISLALAIACLMLEVSTFATMRVASLSKHFSSKRSSYHQHPAKFLQTSHTSV